MKILNFSLLSFSMKSLYILILLSACNKPAKDKPIKLEVSVPSTEITKNKKQLRHVVLFKFKEGTMQEKIVEAEKAFISLPTKISEIKDFEWGINNSPEGLEKGFTHCFFLTFDSEKDRAAYLPHPDHKAFGEILTPILDDVLVLDYWVNE